MPASLEISQMTPHSQLKFSNSVAGGQPLPGLVWAIRFHLDGTSEELSAGCRWVAAPQPNSGNAAGSVAWLCSRSNWERRWCNRRLPVACQVTSRTNHQSCEPSLGVCVMVGRNAIRFVAEYEDGSKERFDIPLGEMQRGEHLARTIAREYQKRGRLKLGKIVKVYRDPAILYF